MHELTTERLLEREYARHEARRGRRFAYESLVPTRSALVVVDLVPFFTTIGPEQAAVVPVVDRLASAARAADGTVAWVLPRPPDDTRWGTEFYGNEVAAAYSASGGEGRAQDRLAEGLRIEDGDLVAEKSSASAFFHGRSTLPDQLRTRGVDTVIVCGLVTNVCVESTVRDAATAGLRVIVVSDACASVDAASHWASLRTIYRSFGDVRPADQVVDLLGQSLPRGGIGD